MQELQDALHRVSQTMRLDLSSSSGSVRHLLAVKTRLHSNRMACLLVRRHAAKADCMQQCCCEIHARFVHVLFSAATSTSS